MSLSVRVARDEDIPILVDYTLKLALETEGGEERERAVAEKGIKALVADPTKGFAYVAVDGDTEVIGCCIVTNEWSDWRNGVVWWLQGIYVREDRRQQGVFKTMYKHIKGVVENDSSIKGIRLFMSGTDEVGTKAFTSVGLNGNHYKQGATTSNSKTNTAKSVSMRPANDDDLSVLLDFQLRMAEETEGLKLERAILEQGLTAGLADSRKCCCYVAIDGNEIVGCNMITFSWSPLDNATVWWLQSVYVKQSHRQCGVFRQMYESLKSTVEQDSSITGLRLYVDVTNHRAQKVYASVGMDGGRYKLFEYLK
ncbi:hypothetical protein R1sor_012693 [Riccia sorocarpa]|uniref:N-acetyltransferase domain-containing protein n=1 Tax=Riccia sorocarpa TaxID=122646 RepID=A0ABD3I754_9MARC